MMKVEIKKVKLSTIKLNPDNPRKIAGPDMDKLVKSLTDFPEMMELREIVVDETMTILGGNMRYQALKKTGAKDCLAKIVKGLTDAQKREFVIKDNSNFGAYDWDVLKSDWADLPLVDWGVELPDDWLGDVEDYADLDRANDDLAGNEDKNITITVPAMHESQVIEWLANGEGFTSPGMGKGVLKRCGLL